MSEKLSGENHPMFGKHRTAETKAKQSTSMIGKNKGKTRTEEQKQKQSVRQTGSANPMFGRHHSPETIEKLRAARKKQFQVRQDKIQCAATI
jgi:hypothetical protein